MKSQKLGLLRFLSLFFLLPGLAGLIFSAWVSTTYLERLPRGPVPEQMRMTPRNIHGIVVYQTVSEDHRLSFMEDVSVGVFLVGLSLGFVYLRKWGLAQALGSEFEEEMVAQETR